MNSLSRVRAIREATTTKISRATKLRRDFNALNARFSINLLPINLYLSLYILY